MRTATLIVAAIVFLFGLVMFAGAVNTPGNYHLGGASAIQVGQVYAEATWRATIAIGAFVMAGVLTLAAGPGRG